MLVAAMTADETVGLARADESKLTPGGVGLMEADERIAAAAELMPAGREGTWAAARPARPGRMMAEERIIKVV